VVFFIGWFVLFSGIMTIAGSISGRDVIPYWGLMLAFGILETLLALWLLARPGLTLVAAVLALGLWAVIYGVVEIVLSFEANIHPVRAVQADREINAAASPRSFGAMAGR